MESAEVKKSRRSIVLLLVVFIIPVVLAKLALEQQWFNYGVTNKGTLVTGTMSLASLGVTVDETDKKWLMLYVLPKDCNEPCLQTLHSVNNTYIALGKEMTRVTPIALSEQKLTELQLQQLAASKWQLQTVAEQANITLPSEQVLIVDPLGNIVLSHVPPSTDAARLSFGKAILSDFKKLLKYSRIG